MANFIIKGVSLENNNLSIPDESLDELRKQLNRMSPVHTLKNFLGRFNIPPAHLKYKYSNKVKYLNDSLTFKFDLDGNWDNTNNKTNKKYYYITTERFDDGKIDNFVVDFFPLHMLNPIKTDSGVIYKYDTVYHNNGSTLIKTVNSNQVVGNEFTDSLYQTLETLDEFCAVYSPDQIVNYTGVSIGDVYFNTETKIFYILDYRTFTVEYSDVLINDKELSVKKDVFQLELSPPPVIEEWENGVDPDDNPEVITMETVVKNTLTITEYFWNEYLEPEDYLVFEEHLVRKWL